MHWGEVTRLGSRYRCTRPASISSVCTLASVEGHHRGNDAYILQLLIVQWLSVLFDHLLIWGINKSFYRSFPLPAPVSPLPNLKSSSYALTTTDSNIESTVDHVVSRA